MLKYTVDNGQPFIACNQCVDWGYIEQLRQAGRLTSRQTLTTVQGWTPRKRTACQFCGTAKLVRAI